MKRHLFSIALAAATLAAAGCTVQPKTKLDAPVAITTKVDGSTLLVRATSRSSTTRVIAQTERERLVPVELFDDARAKLVAALAK